MHIFGLRIAAVIKIPIDMEQTFVMKKNYVQEQLYNEVLNALQPYGVSALFKKEMVTVTNENGNIKGFVRCVLCDTDTDPKKRRRRTEYYSQYWNGQ